MTTPITKRKFTVDEYHRMAQAGILTEDDRVELIQGEIVEMTPVGSKHAACVKRLNRLLSKSVGDKAIVSVQAPVALDPHSEPQPDIALLRPSPDFYAAQHPGPDDVLLIVEVADTSAAYDRDVKLPLYARAGIPEVWLVDLAANRLEVYRGPSPEGYRERMIYRPGMQVSSESLPGLSLPVIEIVGG